MEGQKKSKGIIKVVASKANASSSPSSSFAQNPKKVVIPTKSVISPSSSSVGLSSSASSVSGKTSNNNEVKRKLSVSSSSPSSEKKKTKILATSTTSTTSTTISLKEKDISCNESSLGNKSLQTTVEQTVSMRRGLNVKGGKKKESSKKQEGENKEKEIRGSEGEEETKKLNKGEEEANVKDKDEDVTEEEEGKDVEVAKEEEEKPKPDPYLLEDCEYIKRETRWKNKQRTLVFCSRGINARFRHLMLDIRKLLPHHKPEGKYEKKQKISAINTICEMKTKHHDLYLWVARTPTGPTIKFQVFNVHTTGELKLTGNCLQYSRPFLTFDKSFETFPHLRLIRDLFVHTFGTPRNHPQSKPFFDHVMSFFFFDGKIWFRHYQIVSQTEDDKNNPDRQLHIEIGPRFVLDPIKILADGFSGKTLWTNMDYLTPTALRVMRNKKYVSPYLDRLLSREKRARHVEENKIPDGPLTDQNIFGNFDELEFENL